MSDTSKTNLRHQYPSDWDDWHKEETCTVWEYLIPWLCIPAIGIAIVVVISMGLGYLWGMLI